MNEEQFNEVEELRESRFMAKGDLRKLYKEYEEKSDETKAKNQELLRELKQTRAELKRDKEARSDYGFSNDKDWVEAINNDLTKEQEEKCNAQIKSNNEDLDNLKELLEVKRDEIWNIECKIQNRQIYYS